MPAVSPLLAHAEVLPSEDTCQARPSRSHVVLHSKVPALMHVVRLRAAGRVHQGMKFCTGTSAGRPYTAPGSRCPAAKSCGSCGPGRHWR